MKTCPKCITEMKLITTTDSIYYYCSKCGEIIIVK